MFSPCKVKVGQPCLTLCDPMGYTVHGILQARILEWVAFPISRGSSQPRDRTQVSALQVDSLPAESEGKPKITRVGSLSLFQGIFPTKDSKWVLLHCRRIVYQLSSQESKRIKRSVTKILPETYLLKEITHTIR